MNGCLAEVTTNLEAALQVLSEGGEFKAGLKLWVDALCINQDDFPERNREVKRMRDIYETAADLVIWLGDGKNWLGDQKQDGEAAVEYIQKLHSSFSSPLEFEKRQEEATQLMAALKAQPGFLGVGIWAALYSFLDRPYWNRCWILQELTFAQLTTPLLCGSLHTSWWELYSVLLLLQLCPAPELGNVLHNDFEALGKPQGRLRMGWIMGRFFRLNGFSMDRAEKKHFPVAQLMELARHADATDPRDKVYSLLGLMDPLLATAIDVNCQLPVEQVFEDFTREVIKYSNSFEILRQGNGITRPLWPSWVPDFTRAEHKNAMESVLNAFNASGSQAPLFSFPEQHILRCEGVFVDVVDGLGCKIWDQDGFVDTKGGRWVEEDGEVLEKPKNGISTKIAYGTPEESREALWRTLVGNQTPTGAPAPPSYSTLLDLPWWNKASLTDDLILSMVNKGWDGRFLGKANADFQMLRSQNRDFRIGDSDSVIISRV